MHFVDLGESFPTQIDLQSVASIQPRTTSSKLGSKIVGLAPTQVLRNAGAFPRGAASAAASVSAAFAEAAFRPHPVTAASYAAAGGAHESPSAAENSQKLGPTRFFGRIHSETYESLIES